MFKLTLAAAGRIEHNSLSLFLNFWIAKRTDQPSLLRIKTTASVLLFQRLANTSVLLLVSAVRSRPPTANIATATKSTHTVGSEDNAPSRRAYKAGTRMKTRVSSARKDSLWHFIKVSLLTFYSPRVSYSLHSGQDAL